MSDKKKQLHLAALIYTGRAPQIWRHPDINYHQSLDVNYFIEYAQIAEKAKFDTLFLADGASNTIDEVTKRFWSVSSSEPVTLFSAIAARTEHIGLVYTSSVSDNEPNLVARQLASLDHISHGRAGWNVVTTHGPGSLNLRVPREEEGDSIAKYKRAKLFVEVVKRLWDSFEDDALLRDKESGIHVDVEKVHAPNINNELYKAEQSLKVEQPIQGWPVTAQAASRKTEELVILTGVAVIWGETQQEADRKLKEVSSLWPIEVAVHNLGFNFQIGEVDLDAPFPQDYDRSSGGGFRSSGRAAAIASFAKANNLTLRQTAEQCSIGLGHRPLVGTTKSIADDLQAWLEAGATDGFAVIQPLVIDGLREFSEHVIPELVRRGYSVPSMKEER